MEQLLSSHLASRYAIGLRACYAMSCADLSYDCACLHACYAMSSTDLAYAASRLRARYVMSGTDIGYDYLPTRPLCDVRF
eukprot:3937837-Rhodomonas_salina.1